MVWRVSSISASFMLLRQRTVALLTLARNDPRGSVFLNRYDTGSLIHISYQIPIPMGAPSSELTGWLRRYSWSSRSSSPCHVLDRLAAQIFLVEPQVQHVAGSEKIDHEGRRAYLEGQDVQPGLVQNPDHLPEQHVHAAGALLHDGEQAEHAGEQQHHLLSHKRYQEDDQNRGQGVHLDTSR